MEFTGRCNIFKQIFSAHTGWVMLMYLHTNRNAKFRRVKRSLCSLAKYQKSKELTTGARRETWWSERKSLGVYFACFPFFWVRFLSPHGGSPSLILQERPYCISWLRCRCRLLANIAKEDCDWWWGFNRKRSFIRLDRRTPSSEPKFWTISSSSMVDIDSFKFLSCFVCPRHPSIWPPLTIF